MVNNVVLVSGVQQSDSVIHIHVFILLQVLFPIRFFFFFFKRLWPVSAAEDAVEVSALLHSPWTQPPSC